MRSHLNLILWGAPAIAIAVFAAAPLAGKEPTTDPVTIVAHPDPNTASKRVGYADLNLSQRRDQNRLYHRVSAATLWVCSEQALDQSMFDDQINDCTTRSYKDALPQVRQAINRAVEIAATGSSAIPVVAIAIGAKF